MKSNRSLQSPQRNTFKIKFNFYLPESKNLTKITVRSVAKNCRWAQSGNTFQNVKHFIKAHFPLGLKPLLL